MTAALDDLMETASVALAEMDYATCESLCMRALEQARDAEDWVTVQRVLLPLQEARRQKRQAALDGPILLGTPADAEVPPAVEREGGCVVVTHPRDIVYAVALDANARKQSRMIEVLFADNPADAPIWRVSSLIVPVHVDVPAPNGEWIGRWIDPRDTPPPTPAHWFMQASEALGDAVLDAIQAEPGTRVFFDQLLSALSAAGDHEIMHQRLADAARALHEARR